MYKSALNYLSTLLRVLLNLDLVSYLLLLMYKYRPERFLYRYGEVSLFRLIFIVCFVLCYYTTLLGKVEILALIDMFNLPHFLYLFPN